mmetsp:Transcript_37169/g.75407  ORF Transcript_37169/g.75407 Transcript_37169/m.75407 type:complete len:121 (+) Transcript_37169:477-839(+)
MEKLPQWPGHASSKDNKECMKLLRWRSYHAQSFDHIKRLVWVRRNLSKLSVSKIVIRAILILPFKKLAPTDDESPDVLQVLLAELPTRLSLEILTDGHVSPHMVCFVTVVEPRNGRLERV